jgi:dolichol-phosphate mannosyltransferase
LKIVIIIPTYNERENIGILISALQKQFSGIAHEMNILVVDDNSPDGTSNVVRDEMTKYSNIHLLTGNKNGLGAAYIRGIKYAVKNLGADAVMEMDADFSHKPEDIPMMISIFDKGTDFVIGSRYVNGGKIPENWGFLRKMISKWGNIFARYIAGLHQVRDCTAGFRLIRASIIKKINFEDLMVQGYAFQMALLHQAIAARASVKEIPVEFVDRIRGETKLGLSDIFEFILNAWWIRFQRSKVFIKFAIVGLCGVIVNLAFFTLLIELGLSKFFASPISIELGIIFNFLLNNIWTFAHRNSKNSFNLRGLKFNIVSFLTLGVSYSTFVLLSLLFSDVLPQIHQAIGIIPASIVNYLLNVYWTFQEEDRFLENQTQFKILL